MLEFTLGPATKRSLRLAANDIVDLVGGVRKPASAVVVGDLIRCLGRVMAIQRVP